MNQLSIKNAPKTSNVSILCLHLKDSLEINLGFLEIYEDVFKAFAWYCKWVIAEKRMLMFRMKHLRYGQVADSCSDNMSI